MKKRVAIYNLLLLMICIYTWAWISNAHAETPTPTAQAKSMVEKDRIQKRIAANQKLEYLLKQINKQVK